MIATVGVVLGAAYMLWLTKRVIFGESKTKDMKDAKDINLSEAAILISLAFLVIFFGLFPTPLIDTLNISVDNLISNYQADLISITAQK